MGLLAISPLLVFIFLYLVTSIIAGDFYKVPITVAFMVSSIYAIVVSGGKPLQQRINIFSKGASDEKIMLMIWIFILAGAFANSAKVMGSIDATVALTLNILPSNMLLAAIFFAACFVSFSIGTSVGTIVALTPLAAGMSESTGISPELLTAIVVSGSLFGDNLSLISDTTIVATSTQGCKLKDKFKVNLYLAFPAAIIILFIYLFMGSGITPINNIPETDYIKILPYIIVLIAAISGVNVVVVLTIGIALTGMIGLVGGSFNVYGWFSAMGDGIIGMGELIIVTMLAGGMLEIIKDNGGINYIIDKLTHRIHTKRSAELSIATLVSFTNICTANNTVAIITVGGIAKQISERFGVDSRRSASILDTMSCCIQGIIPYGAQILIASGLSMVNPISIIPYLWYPLCLGAFTLIAIMLRYPRKYS